MPALIGIASTSANGTISPATASPLISNTTTSLPGSVGVNVVNGQAASIGDSGYGATDFGSTPYAGSLSSGQAFIVGMLGMF